MYAELVSQLQSAEARCQVLEKQLDHMKWMVEKAEQDKNALADKQVACGLLHLIWNGAHTKFFYLNCNYLFNSLLHQASLYKEKASEVSSLQTQREKLDKLEKECIKLSQTQSQAEVTCTGVHRRTLNEILSKRLTKLALG